MNRIKIFALSWTILIIVLSLLSKGTSDRLMPFDIFQIDKLGHLIFYGMLSYLWAASLFDKLNFSRTLRLFISCFILGLLMEYCQVKFTDGRQFEWADLLANTIGILVGIMVFGWRKRMKNEELKIKS